MVKQIDDLKKMIQNKMVLKGAASEIEIERSANNILRMHGRLVTWGTLQDLLASGEYDLMTQDGKKVIDAKERGWGGARVAGPGKKLGAPKKDPRQKKKPVSFSMTEQTRDKLDALCEQLGKKRSEVLELLIDQAS